MSCKQYAGVDCSLVPAGTQHMTLPACHQCTSVPTPVSAAHLSGEVAAE